MYVDCGMLFTGGEAISRAGGHGDLHALPYDRVLDDPGIATLEDGPAGCREAARLRIREGADLLKSMTTGGVLSTRDSPAHPSSRTARSGRWSRKPTAWGSRWRAAAGRGLAFTAARAIVIRKHLDRR